MALRATNKELQITKKNLKIPLNPEIILNLILFFITNLTKNYHAQTKKLKIYLTL